MPRLFTGLEIPADVAAALVLHRGGLPGARWMDPADYHITLRFLGDVDGHMANDVFGFLQDIQRASLTITLEGLDSFGGDKPRSVFARVRQTQELSALQADHEKLMRRLGLPPEKRKFTPHVTLARLKDASPVDVAWYLASRPLVKPVHFRAPRFVLFSSRASVGGGPYVIEAAYPLGEMQGEMAWRHG
jgi:RNA 2',3'-cyclic 3'-phosphodiesterase